MQINPQQEGLETWKKRKMPNETSTKEMTVDNVIMQEDDRKEDRNWLINTFE